MSIEVAFKFKVKDLSGTVNLCPTSSFIAYAASPQHFLYFLPLPQGHGPLRLIFGADGWADG
jgi:hypothetical protein